eukprot:TRINITY_DN14633_c0_g1_i1.p1 TRINITY_DN14633_c0_g1~~TRINITY_DN14633_c0_g1_i1.p1  ORF type:complete len:450 (-),score=101.50 TRINITY_DN14633_c0_g1_i1:205-1554(-)
MFTIPPPKALDPSTDPRYTHKGKFSAWLIKAKSDGCKAKWFQTLGRRYFTIDFDRRIFYYQHGESRYEKASTPIHFREILGAHSGHSYEDDPACGKGRGLTRSFSSVMARQKPPAPGIFPFTVRTVGKRLRLEAEVEAETFHWIAMLNAAHRIGRDVDMLSCSSELADDSAALQDLPLRASTPDSSSASSRSDREKPPSVTSDKASQQSTAADSEETDSGLQSPKAWSEAGAAEEFHGERREDAEVQACMERTTSQQGIAGCCMRGYLGRETEEEAPRGGYLQAADFGFDEEDLGAYGDEVSPQHSPAATPRAASCEETEIKVKEEAEVSDTPTLEQAIAKAPVAQEIEESEDEASPANYDAPVDASRAAADMLLLQRQTQAKASKPKRKSRGGGSDCSAEAGEESAQRPPSPRSAEQAARVAADLMLLQSEAARRTSIKSTSSRNRAD